MGLVDFLEQYKTSDSKNSPLPKRTETMSSLKSKIPNVQGKAKI